PTFDREIRISIGVQSHLDCGFRVATATPRVHGGECSTLVRQNHAASGNHGVPSGTVRSRRFAQELTMSRVAEIEVRVAPAAGDEIRTSRNGLGLHGLQRAVGFVLRSHYGGYGSLEVHGDRGPKLPVGRTNIQRALVTARNLFGYAKVKAHGLAVATTNVDRRCL